jgi:hypothetical protein
MHHFQTAAYESNLVVGGVSSMSQPMHCILLVLVRMGRERNGKGKLLVKNISCAFTELVIMRHAIPMVEESSSLSYRRNPKVVR